jgi:hypothetical protein
MILTVNDTGKLLIGKKQILAAIAECMELLPNYQGFVMASGKSTISEVAALLIEDVWASRNKRIAKGEFLSRHFHIFDSELLDKCITTLSQAELIRMTLADGNIESYELTSKCIDKFNLKEEK